MSQIDPNHAWWSRLRHQGLLLSPVVMLEKYVDAPSTASYGAAVKLRDANTRFASSIDTSKGEVIPDEADILRWVDSVLEGFAGNNGRLVKQGHFAEKFTAAIRIGTKTETLRPDRVLFSDALCQVPSLLVLADTSPQVGRGRGRNSYARMIELLRSTGHRLGLLTNGRQFRIIYAGLDFESWSEWETDRWFDDGEGTQELLGLRQLLSPASLEPHNGICGLLEAVEESRKKQADLSSVLRENVRQAVELLLDEVSAANRTKTSLLDPLLLVSPDHRLTDAEAHEALMQASVRVVMRLVVCLFAESRELFPINDPTYAQGYGVRTLYELLDETARYEGSDQGMLNRQIGWCRLMALFRLIHGGSAHGNFAVWPYSGTLFRPGDLKSEDAVARALHLLEYEVEVSDATIYQVLRKLLRGPLPVMRGRTKSYVEGPVDYTDLRTEFIGLIYEGLLDYRLKRTDAESGPQVFLNIGREPVLPLGRLEEMLQNDPKALKELLTTLSKEKVVASAGDDEGEPDDEDSSTEEGQDESAEVELEAEGPAVAVAKDRDYLDAVDAATKWAKQAVLLAGLVGKKKAKEPDSEYQTRIEAEAKKLIKKVVAVGEYYLVRAGNTRKGTGTFYTRPQLAVPTVHRTLEPLCYGKAQDGTLVPKTPEVILALKVCDPGCGSASFLVAGLHYLTDALYKSLCYHRHLDDPAQAMNLTLPFGRPRTGKPGDELVPFPPNDPQRGDSFTDRIKALLRRHVVERCIYGVDINPLAVEFARVSLWVETLDPELPFSFLDHKIKVGNSLVGCWLDRVLDYPLKAWEREGGDGKAGPRTQAIEEFLNGAKGSTGRRSGDGIIKQEMRQLIESKFSQQPSLFPDTTTTAGDIVAAARVQYERLHEMSNIEPEKKEDFYRTMLEHSPAVCSLKRAMDEWCAIWFWPADSESLQHVTSPLSFHGSTPERDRIVERLASELHFFHWELAFPDVFTPNRTGFDAVLGNPPWEIMKPKSHEFFTEYDPLYRTYDKQTALSHQQIICSSVSGVTHLWNNYNGLFKALSNWVGGIGDPFDLPLARGKEQKQLALSWANVRQKRVGFGPVEKPFRTQGSADLNSYKLFLELAYRLLAPTGRLGFIVPSGLYTDMGTKDLRGLFLDHATWNWLFSFENKKRIFAIHGSFKFAAVIVDRRHTDDVMNTAFMIHDLADWERTSPPVFPFDRDLIPLFSPRSKSLPEVRTQRDFGICRRIYENSIRIGDNAPGWEITYAREFDMTNDSKHFSPRERWVSSGYKPDVFGRWIGPDGDAALPLYEGRMIGPFDVSKKGWVNGKGRTAVWRDVAFDDKTIEPQFLIADQKVLTSEKYVSGIKLGYMSIGSATNSRTGIACALSGVPCGNSVSALRVAGGNLGRTLYVAAAVSSLSYDFALRARVGGINLNWFILEESAIPRPPDDGRRRLIQLHAARLTFLHRRFSPEWLKLRKEATDLAGSEWKVWWAVTETNRLRLQAEVDAVCADLYGLDPDDFDWIVRDDPTDPKGFWRVDKELPHRERLTGLAAAAFRALKDNKWSAETAASLSNDEFFEILRIPELTNPAAAKAKGLAEPLIHKRPGCHVWEPEKFTKDDPRYGWTWEHCWQDAVALLGSEQAVKDYIEAKPPAITTNDAAQGVLRGQGTQQKGLFG